MKKQHFDFVYDAFTNALCNDRINCSFDRCVEDIRVVDLFTEPYTVLEGMEWYRISTDKTVLFRGIQTSSDAEKILEFTKSSEILMT